MPEVPARMPSVEEDDEKLDLPDVPTKAPVAPEVVVDDASAGVSARKKGLSLSLSLC